MAIDFKGIDEAAKGALASLVQKWIPGGIMEGDEYVVRNPTRTDGKPGSFKINVKTAVWCDWAGGEKDKGNGAITLYAYARSIRNGEAARAIAEELGREDLLGPRMWKNQDLEPVVPAPPDAPEPPKGITYRGKPEVARWLYRDTGGRLVGLVVRVQKEADGSDKEFQPMVYCRAPDGSHQWGFKGLPKPRPLYGSELLAARPDDAVLIVEGEKACDAARRLYPSYIGVTWPNGSNSVKHADWSLLKGRNVAIWPDADKPGRRAAAAIVDLLKDVAAAVKVLNPPDGVAEGWDAADAEKEGRDPVELRDLLKREVAAEPEPAAGEGPAPGGDRPASGGADKGGIDKDAREFIASEIVPLGFDRGRYFYLPRVTGQVVEITAANHSKSQLLALAPLNWFEAEFSAGQGGVSWIKAQNALMRSCEQRGVFNPDRLRGRGAWWDKERVILHLGDKMLVDGAPTALHQLESDFIYERNIATPYVSATAPLPVGEARKVLKLCTDLSWENALSAYLLAGWCAVAPICGALPWRPHIWITGPKGSGKSWTLTHVVRPLVSPARSLFIAGNTTEAYVRQTLRTDAFPVLYDETEAQSRAGRERLASMLELIRGSSSEDAGRIGKGSAAGRATNFNIRSCFAMSSIYVNLTEAADFSRTSILSMAPTGDQAAEAWGGIQKAAAALTPAFADQLLARSIELLPVILHNAKVFGDVVRARELGDQRFADQTGTLLAGAWSLYSDDKIERSRASEFVEKHDWAEIVEGASQDDSIRCLLSLLHRIVAAEGAGQRRIDRQLGELIGVAAGQIADRSMGSDDDGRDATIRAQDNLGRWGIRVIGDEFLVARHSPAATKIFADTAFEHSHGKLLARLSFARVVENPIRFRFSESASSEKVRAVAINIRAALSIA